MDLSSYKFLITGGAGFIGSHLADELVKQNAKVFIIDNLSTGNLNNIRHLKNIEFIQADINDVIVLNKILPETDFVFHLTALGSVNRSIEDPLSTHLSNSTGFLNILHYSFKHQIKGLIYSSSSSVYGDDTHLPKMEEKTGNPLSPYAVTKITNELYAYVYNHLHKFPVIGLRYFNVFGPRQNPYGAYAAAIPLFIQKMLNNELVHIHGSGEQKRDFTYVSNVVNANLCALKAILQDNKDVYGKVFNIGCHQSISINEVFRTIASYLGYTQKPIYTEPRKGDIFQSLADISKAQKILNYQPEVYFDKGIQLTIQYYKNLITEKIEKQ